MTRSVFFYLSSYGTSILGNSITAVALPLLVLFTTGSPLGAGAVAIAAAVPSAIAGILMGSLIDKINRRTAAVLSDVISAVALLMLPIVEMTVGLNLGWFIAIAILNSFGDVPGITARDAMIPSISRASGVDSSRLIGLKESLGGGSMLVGPAIAGLLVATLEPVSVMWVTAGVAAVAAILSLGIPYGAAAVNDPADTPRPGGVFDGVVIIFRHPLLRVMVLLSLVLAVALAALQGMVIPVHFAFRDEAELVGFVLSSLAAGLLVGGAVFAVLGEKVSRRVWFFVGVVVVAAGFVVIGVLGPAWSIFLGAALVGVGGGCMNAVIGLTFIENVHDNQRGKVLGAQNAIMTLVPALGVGGAAVLIEVGSLGLTTTVLAALWIVAAIVALLSPRVRRLGQETA